MPTKPILPSQHAFVLIEILVALFIFAIGSTSIWALWTSAVATHQQALTEQAVAMLGESLVAEIQYGILRGQPLSTVRGVASQQFPGYQYDLIATDLGGYAVLLEISIVYSRYGQGNRHSFRTVFYRYGQQPQ